MSECFLGKFVGGSSVVWIYVVVVELGERGVHVGMGQQVVEAPVAPGEGGGFVEFVYGTLVIGNLTPGDAAPGVALGVLGLQHDHLGEVVDGADVVANAVLVVGATRQDFIPFVGLVRAYAASYAAAVRSW